MICTQDEGCFEINPPFTLSGNHVSDHMGRILQRAEDLRKPLTFVMVHAAPHARVARLAGQLADADGDVALLALGAVLPAAARDRPPSTTHATR